MSARPRLRTLVAAAVAAPLALVAVTAPADAAKRATVDQYVALGDSYASGNGTQYPDLDLSCYRSSLAYPPLIAKDRPNTALTFKACSGAETGDVMNGQTSALSRRTNYVSISIGGNDVGFTDLILSCFDSFDEAFCRSTVDTVNRRIDTELPAKLDATYADIRSRAPKATVMVVGYPLPFGSDVSCVQAQGISPTEAPLLDDVGRHLDAVIADRASAAGFTYIDPVPAFTGHDVCAATPWIWGKVTGVYDIYHPRRAGHRDGFEPLVRAVMG